MKDTFYFQHDYNARNDPKIQRVLMEHGAAGIGIFWCVVEMLYEQGGYMPLNDCKSIAFALHEECKTVQSIINDYDLFCNDGEVFWSQSAIDRLDKRKGIAEKRKSAAEARWAQRDNHQQPEQKSDANELDYDLIVSKFNSICVSLPKVQKLTQGRKNKVKARLKEMKNDMQQLELVFQKMEASDFCKGINSNGWKATFDWVFDNDKNWVKVTEGNYDNDRKSTGKVNNIWDKNN